MKRKLYQIIASELNRITNAKKSNNETNFQDACYRLSLLSDCLPSGSGINGGCEISIDKSNDAKIVIYFSYHFMSDNGYYTNWLDYKLVLTPSLLSEFEIKIYGYNQNDVKDYLYDVFQTALNDTYEIIYNRELNEIKYRNCAYNVASIACE